jgi:hypothetical protein
MLDRAEVSYLWYYAIGPMAALFVVALVLLWLRHRSVLDLWLMLVLFAYVIEIALIRRFLFRTALASAGMPGEFTACFPAALCCSS